MEKTIYTCDHCGKKIADEEHSATMVTITIRAIDNSQHLSENKEFNSKRTFHLHAPPVPCYRDSKKKYCYTEFAKMVNRFMKKK